jgi:hypothetical protein
MKVMIQVWPPQEKNLTKGQQQAKQRKLKFSPLFNPQTIFRQKKYNTLTDIE